MNDAKFSIASCSVISKTTLAGVRLAASSGDSRVSCVPSGPVPVDGAARGDLPPAFDQQPIEVAALADACARAESVTGDATWRSGVELAIGWFAGNNDGSVSMSDPVTGGGFDGLTANGPNLNQGAESTLALITTMQHRREPGGQPLWAV